MSIVNEVVKVAPQRASILKKERFSNTFEGKIVSITSNSVVMTNKEGKEYSHTLAKDAKLTRDGTICKVEDLKAGSKIRLTTKKEDRNVATRIECLDKNAEIEPCCN